MNTIPIVSFFTVSSLHYNQFGFGGMTLWPQTHIKWFPFLSSLSVFSLCFFFLQINGHRSFDNECKWGTVNIWKSIRLFLDSYSAQSGFLPLPIVNAAKDNYDSNRKGFQLTDHTYCGFYVLTLHERSQKSLSERAEG